MPQTLTGLILFAALLLSGSAAGATTARLVTTARAGQAIDRREAVTAAALGALLVASAMLLV